jgi:recombining binding protein (suppressor of hairless)
MPLPLDIYLGTFGPLRHRVYQTTSTGSLLSMSPFNSAMTPIVDSHGPDGSQPGPMAGPPRLNTPLLHTIVIAELPSMAEFMKLLEDESIYPTRSPDHDVNDQSPPHDGTNGSGMAGRSLPLLLIRPLDGVGYHSGRSIACESTYHGVDMGPLGSGPPAPLDSGIDTGWINAAQSQAVAEGRLHGWTLRVI